MRLISNQKLNATTVGGATVTNNNGRLVQIDGYRPYRTTVTVLTVIVNR